MVDAKRKRLLPIHEIIPPEVFVKILKKLAFKKIGCARGICRQWKIIIDAHFPIVKAACSKYSFHDLMLKEKVEMGFI